METFHVELLSGCLGEMHIISELVSYCDAEASVRRPSVRPSVNFFCPRPVLRHEYEMFI